VPSRASSAICVGIQLPFGISIKVQASLRYKFEWGQLCCSSRRFAQKLSADAREKYCQAHRITGMTIARNYNCCRKIRESTSNADHDHNLFATVRARRTDFLRIDQPPIRDARPHFGRWACLFWLAVSPTTGLFCASVALYDKIGTLKAQEIRPPDLRRNPAHNPLVLRRNTTPERNRAAPPCSATRTFHA
jgi:hypothetical protein